MKRRDFVRSGLALGAAAFGPVAGAATHARPAAARHAFNLKYAPHEGMFRHHAGDDFIDQIEFMADVGFTALEDNGMMGRSVSQQEKIASTLQRRGMDMGVFVVDKGGNGANTLAAGRPDHLDIFLDGCRRAVEVAKRVNATWMTVVPGDFQRDLPEHVQTANTLDALRRGADIFEKEGLVMVLEPLSDTPDLFLRTSDQAYLLCKAVDSPACKILFDIYHLQKNEGNIIANLDATWDEIAYIQIGDNPGRNEPTTGEINYRNVFAHIHNKGFGGICGMEHGISGSGKAGEQQLIDAYVAVDSFR